MVCRAMREKYLTTYGDAHSDTPPFTDLFQGQVRGVVLGPEAFQYSSL